MAAFCGRAAAGLCRRSDWGGVGAGTGWRAGGTVGCQVTMAVEFFGQFWAATPENRNMADASAQQHILYLDDDDALVFLVRRLLQRRGYRVTALTDQEQAIAAVRANPQGFDLVLTDHNMPGLLGLDVARAMLALNPALPVVLTSGCIDDGLQAQALAAGVRAVVQKADAVDVFCEGVALLLGAPPH
jgi:two-component system, cell cycle sensor histidine kinase and response regulator CckA